MKANVRGVLVQISAKYLVLKYKLWQFMLKTDLDSFSIGKMAPYSYTFKHTPFCEHAMKLLPLLFWSTTNQIPCVNLLSSKQTSVVMYRLQFTAY